MLYLLQQTELTKRLEHEIYVRLLLTAGAGIMLSV
jgi:hypothetical protein